MTQFHEGQEVEVLADHPAKFDLQWRKAKIIEEPKGGAIYHYTVQFPDDSRAVFDAGNIRAAESTEAKHQTLLAGDSAEEHPGPATRFPR